MFARVLLVAAPLLLVMLSACVQQKRLADKDAERCKESAGAEGGPGDMSAEQGNAQLLVPECPTPAQRWVPGVH